MSEEEYRERMLKALGEIVQADDDLNDNLYRIARQFPQPLVSLRVTRGEVKPSYNEPSGAS